MKIMYKAAYASCDGMYYVNGPCQTGECSYHGGTLNPSSRMETEEEANRAARFANIGYAEGYKQAQKNIRLALGIYDKE